MWTLGCNRQRGHDGGRGGEIGVGSVCSHWRRKPLWWIILFLGRRRGLPAADR
jgi:hypothetical protein